MQQGGDRVQGTAFGPALKALTDPDTFWWAVGIEDSFLPSASPRTGRTLDLYELTGHYDRWADDIDRMASLGVPVVRYGVPWPRISPAPGRWDWDWSDRAVDRILQRGMAPIIDLVHYGVPGWLDGAFLHPDYPLHVSEYALRAADRFQGRVFLWTPLNEPRITAWHCGRTGTWPPYGRSWRGFVAVLLAVCRGIVRTTHALHVANPENILVHVDAANWWLPPDPPEDATLQALTTFRQQLVFLALDLVAGKVDDQHALRPWLLRHGGTPFELDWFREQAIDLDLVAFNLYPMLSQKQYVRTASGGVRVRFPTGDADTVERAARLYWERYGRPLLLGETAARGRVARRLDWLRTSVEGVRRARAAGVPMIGYTWWPVFDLMAWSYRQGRAPLAHYVVPMGLWRLDPETLDRLETPLVPAFAELVAGGAQAVGPVARLERSLPS